MGLSPAASRRRLGVELRALREAAGKRIEDAAEALDCSTAKISRLETGKGVPFPRDVRDLVQIYGSEAREKSEYLLELVSDGRAQDWFSTFRDVLHGEMFADHLFRFMELERDADVIKTFEADLIPGMLQTEEYIDAVCSIVAPERSEKERRRFVEFRLERQKVLLYQGKLPELSMILSELAIIRQIGGPGVMRRQLEVLRADLDEDTGRLKAMDFRLTPIAAGARGALGGPFTIMKYIDSGDQDIVYLEGREGASYLESDGDVSRYEQLFSSLERDSHSRSESIKLLEQKAENLG